MISLSPRAVIHDAGGLFALLEILSKPELAGELLKDLTEQANRAVEAENATAKLAVANGEMKQRLDAQAAEQMERDRFLNDREATLKDAEQQWTFSMAQERKAMDELRARQNKLAAEKAEELNGRENKVNEQAKDVQQLHTAIIQWQQRLQAREAALTEAEQKLSADQEEHAQRIAKLRELTA